MTELPGVSSVANAQTGKETSDDADAQVPGGRPPVSTRSNTSRYVAELAAVQARREVEPRSVLSVVRFETRTVGVPAPDQVNLNPDEPGRTARKARSK